MSHQESSRLRSSHLENHRNLRTCHSFLLISSDRNFFPFNCSLDEVAALKVASVARRTCSCRCRILGGTTGLMGVAAAAVGPAGAGRHRQRGVRGGAALRGGRRRAAHTLRGQGRRARRHPAGTCPAQAPASLYVVMTTDVLTLRGLVRHGTHQVQTAPFFPFSFFFGGYRLPAGSAADRGAMLEMRRHRTGIARGEKM